MSNEVQNITLHTAHGYAQFGFKVVPLHSVGPDGKTCSCRKGAKCSSAGKHPIHNDWSKTPAPSGPDLEEIWRLRPKANVGIATGDASGFWVLDIDPEHGGLESWQSIKQGLYIPSTYAVRTGSGGWHFYFRMPNFPVTNSPAAFKGTGIDIRGTGGQVVAPPSVSDKGTYVAHGSLDEIAAAPAWLLDLVRKQEPTTPPVTAADFEHDLFDGLEPAEQQRLQSYAQTVVNGEIGRLRQLKDGGWKGEPWDTTTFEVACTLIEIANSPWNTYTIDHAYTHLLTNTPTDEGFTTETIKAKFASARQKVGDKAREMPAAPPSDPLSEPNPDVRVDPILLQQEDAQPAIADGTGYLSPELFFIKSSPQIKMMRDHVTHPDRGPVAWGGDNAFWSYDGGVWTSDRFVIERRLVDLLGDRFKSEIVNNVTKSARHTVQQLECNPVKRYVNFTNGMLDWKTSELVDHSPEYGSTVQMSIDWEPEATCPTFDGWLADVLHADYIEMAWEMIGYLMMSGNPLQIAFLLYGRGQNGKGTLMRVLTELLGHRSIAAESLDMLNSNNFSAVNLFGKTANMAGDIDGTYQESTANFKKLTGEDCYAAERKYGDRFTFESWAVPVFSANKIPGSADVTEGYLRRWVVIHFAKQITKEDRILSLSDDLAKELPGIAARAIPALRTLMGRGYFDPQGKALEAKEMFAETIDQVRRWLSTCMKAPDDRWEPATAVYQTYLTWAGSNGIGRLNSTEFFHRLEALGVKKSHQGGLDGYLGLLADLTQPHAKVDPEMTKISEVEGDL